MELVIKIPDEYYESIKEIPVEQSSADMLIIRTGTPLPEGHGRLGDLDALETGMVNGIRAGNYEEGYETFAHIVDMDDCVDYVRYADTIIEAERNDKE